MWLAFFCSYGDVCGVIRTWSQRVRFGFIYIDAVEEHRGKGGDCEVDASHLAFLDDAEELEEIRQRSSSGNMLARELKAELLKVCISVQYVCVYCCVSCFLIEQSVWLCDWNISLKCFCRL